MKSDIDIAQAAKLEKITSIAEKLDIPENCLEPYGHYKAKISLDFLKSLEKKEDGKLILVTAISPTPAGEGKTTTSVGLGDALNKIGKKSISYNKRAISWASIWNERWCCWWRYGSSNTNGRYQSTFHR
jgi:formate--tetrahydrofolate ligase